VFPFELYCRKCGSKILSLRVESSEELVNTFRNDMVVDSWLSDKLRNRDLVCPNCRRQIQPDPLIRADVLFSDWGDEPEADKTIVYYI
jgi:hypothetical protein